jgi:hypothetical protein
LGPKSFATSRRTGRPDEYTDKRSPFGHAGDGMLYVADTQTLFATRSPVRSIGVCDSGSFRSPLELLAGLPLRWDLVRHFSPLFSDSIVSWRSQALNQTS